MRVLLTFAYKGTNYHGFAIQKNQITVQQTIQNALEKIFKSKIEIFASGRTDAGVHALAQTAHFDVETNMPVCNFKQVLNNVLPKDIRVISAKQVSSTFHARFSAVKKTYRYVVCNQKDNNPILADVVFECNCLLDMKKMKKAAKHLIGQHNFKSFCAADTKKESYVRKIDYIKIFKKQNYIMFDVCGNGFLHNMVRIIVGTLLEVGMGKIPPLNIVHILNSQNRANAGRTAHSEGLYLKNVEYK